MTPPRPASEGMDLSKELQKRRRIIGGELRERNLWFIQLRWWVPPGVIFGALFAHTIGVEFSFLPTLAVGGFILAYNIVLHFLGRKLKEPKELTEEGIRELQHFTYWQEGLDYAVMFLLIHFTGGAASPLIFFFIFHIIFSSILLPPRSAYGFAAIAAGGMALIAAAEYLFPWFPNHTLVFRGRTINLAREPFHMLIELTFFSASVFIAAFTTTQIMKMLRRRIIDLAELSEVVTRLNNRFNSLYAMVQAIGSERNLDKVLKIVTSELANVIDVKAISVKLLSEDGKKLHYAAAYGLPESFYDGKVVDVEKSPLNRQIIEGQPFATGHLTQREMFQFGEDLIAARIQSVLFVPLTLEERVIGILGAYCTQPERFNAEEIEFFRLAAGLVAIALDNARSYQTLTTMIQERSRFFLRVAHNLRSPLAAVLSMIEVIKSAHFGPLSPDQAEYLRRIERRCRSMLLLINELLTLATSRTERMGQPEKKTVEVAWLAGRIERTFHDSAREKNISFTVTVAPDLPPLWGNPDSLEQMLENLVSNAIKYTPGGGRVGVVFSRSLDNMISIEVNDTGIGIPRDAMPRLFSEFFRATNAREVEEVGTGLGLAIVKEIVELHEGRIHVESEEGCGTIFVVRLPPVPAEEGVR